METEKPHRTSPFVSLFIHFHKLKMEFCFLCLSGSPGIPLECERIVSELASE